MSFFLRFESIEKSFGDKKVLDGVTLGLARGECVALLGESGCGKTSLLNIAAGFLKADSGRLTCDGQPLDDGPLHVPPRRRGFGMVFQDFSLWPHMTIGRNVGFGLELHGFNRADREAKARQALERVGLAGRENDYPTQLSGGQQQRVAIARAIVVEPRLLLLDEPLSALDARMRDELRDEIARMVRSLGITALYVTHDQTEALTVAHRVAVMRNGRIEQEATPEEIYINPANAFVATFLGAANILNNGAFMLRRESVEIYPGGAGDIPPGFDVLQGHCLISRYVGGRYEVTIETHSGELLRGYSPEALAPGSPASARFAQSARRSFGGSA